MECLQPREVHSCEVAKHGIYFASRTIHLYREADVSQEETGRSTEQSRRGMGPSTYARIMEITSGSTDSQPGTRSNLQRLVV